jgi:excisionase family DNA binding protein
LLSRSAEKENPMETNGQNIRLLTLSEVATILKISKRTLHRMIQHHQIPAFKVGGQWRILESRFQEWMQVEEHTAPRVG